MLDQLNESSLTRVWQHAQDKDKTLVIFTSFRDEFSRQDNIKYNKIFASKIKAAGFGYFYVNGFFPENEGTSEETNVKEDSIFAIANNADEGKKLIALCHKLANSRNQDSIIVKEPVDGKSQVYFLDKNKKKIVLSGGLKAGKLGKYYTQLRNKKASNTFIFEGEIDGKGYFQSFREFYQNKT